MLYRFAALTLADPLTHAWDRLVAVQNDSILDDAAAIVRDAAKRTPCDLGLGERPPADLDPRLVLSQLSASRLAHNAEYEKTFGLLVSSVCPPYEMEYVGSKFDFQRSNTLSDVSGFYQAFGLAVSQEHPERPDHITLELEFMGHLLELERRATLEQSESESGSVETCREAQAHFLRDHLAWWLPAFARLLTRESSGKFFPAVGAFLAALIPAERTILRVESQSRPVTPSQPERPEACEGCQLVS
jgi:TorA maturation chaperone TorD